MTTSSVAPATDHAPRSTRRAVSTWRAGIGAAFIAAVVNGMIFLVARAADVSFLVRFSSHQAASRVTGGSVLFSSAIALIVGTAMAAWASSRLRRGVRVVQIAGAAMALLSLAVPLSVHANAGTKLALASMHLVAGSVFIISLQYLKSSVRRTGDDRRAESPQPVGDVPHTA